MTKTLDPNYEFSPDGVVLPSMDSMMHEAWINPGLGARIVTEATYAQDAYWAGTPWVDAIDRPNDPGLGKLRIHPGRGRGLRHLVARRAAAAPAAQVVRPPRPVRPERPVHPRLRRPGHPPHPRHPGRPEHAQRHLAKMEAKLRAGTLQGLGEESPTTLEAGALLASLGEVISSWDTLVAYIRANYGESHAASYDAVKALLSSVDLTSSSLTSLAINAYSRLNTWYMVATDFLTKSGPTLEREDSGLMTEIGSWVNDIVQKRNAVAIVQNKSPLWEGLKTYGEGVLKRVENMAAMFDVFGGKPANGGGSGGGTVLLIVGGLAALFLLSRKRR